MPRGVQKIKDLNPQTTKKLLNNTKLYTLFLNRIKAFILFLEILKNLTLNPKGIESVKKNCILFFFYRN